jgi:hypothetical protein
MKEKEFDSVEMMREIRNSLYEQYKKDPEARKRDLALIRKKYKITTYVESAKR